MPGRKTMLTRRFAKVPYPERGRGSQCWDGEGQLFIDGYEYRRRRKARKRRAR